MKKLIMSMVVAPLLVTSAFALEDIKVNGQAKLWYETNNAAGTDGSDTMFNTENSSAEVVFKLGMTGKQGEVGFGATVYQGSSMGLEGTLVGATRTNVTNGDMFVGEAYITAPLGASTTTKIGKQELNTPLAFTEKWNAMPNTFNAAVVMNNSIDNLTFLGAYVGQTNTGGYDGSVVPADLGTWKVNGDVSDQMWGGAGAIAALYKTDALSVNVWGYYLKSVLGTPDGDTGGVNVPALWVDAGLNIADVSNVKLYLAHLAPDGAGALGEATTAAALSADFKVAGWTLFGAGSMVTEDGLLRAGNVATGFKKTKLPTAGVYTDGVYVARPGSTAVKAKASGKVGSTGLALQAVMNMNSDARYELASGDSTYDATEVDLIITQKLGVFNNKVILMQRMFADDTINDGAGATHVRLITSVNF